MNNYYVIRYKSLFDILNNRRTNDTASVSVQGGLTEARAKAATLRNATNVVICEFDGNTYSKVREFPIEAAY